MSDCLGMCLQIIDNGVSIGTSACSFRAYSNSGGQMVLTGSNQNPGVFLTSFV